MANPTKFGDLDVIKDLIAAAMSEPGWSEPLRLETAADDTGTGQAAAAVQAGVNLVSACRELRVEVGREQPWQADGDVMGRTSHLVVTIAASALLLRVPAQSTSE